MSELIPEGTYVAVATPVEGEDGSHIARFGTTKGRDGGRGIRQVLIYFEILDGPHAGQRLPWFGYFGQKSFKRTLQALRYCGWTGDELADLDSQDLDQKVEIVVGHNSYINDNDREITVARVDWVNRLGAGVIKLADPMGETDLRAFSARMKGHAREAVAVQGERAARAARADRSGGNGQPSNSYDDNGPTDPDDLFPDTDAPPASTYDDDIPF